jgi:hypothetical protein
MPEVLSFAPPRVKSPLRQLDPPAINRSKSKVSDDQDWRTERVLNIALDDQRHRLIDSFPQIHTNVESMTALIRELVNLEREKLGLDRPRGTLELYSNKGKKQPSDPDLTGSGLIAGRRYRAAAWLSGKDKIRISLLPKTK